jgi:hypothetical protein
VGVVRQPNVHAGLNCHRAAISVRPWSLPLSEYPGGSAANQSLLAARHAVVAWVVQYFAFRVAGRDIIKSSEAKRFVSYLCAEGVLSAHLSCVNSADSAMMQSGWCPAVCCVPMTLQPPSASEDRHKGFVGLQLLIQVFGMSLANVYR